MSELGVVSQNILSIQQMQMSLIKNNAEMQQKAVEILLEDNSVAPSLTKGVNVDVML